MITALTNNYNIFRVVTSIILILITGFRLAMPLFFKVKPASRTVLTDMRTAGTDTEKKVSHNPLNENEFASIYTPASKNIIPYISICHNTVYCNNYQSKYQQEIAIPPPDLI